MVALAGLICAVLLLLEFDGGGMGSMSIAWSRGTFVQCIRRWQRSMFTVNTDISLQGLLQEYVDGARLMDPSPE